ncbi:hypothetical protein J6590_031123 [Homalodisca vitripennis]|nr:hypothetical protein J6590_031123 [Homalodisca vitripennis]
MKHVEYFQSNVVPQSNKVTLLLCSGTAPSHSGSIDEYGGTKFHVSAGTDSQPHSPPELSNSSGPALFVKVVTSSKRQVKHLRQHVEGRLYTARKT